MKTSSMHFFKMTLAVMTLMFTTTVNSLASQGIIQSPDVYQLAVVVAEEIEHLRWVMGRPKLVQAPPQVQHVSPHEVYFQAITLFEKTDRLAFELTLNEGNPPVPPSGAIAPKDVYTVIKDAHKRLIHVKNQIGIKYMPQTPDRDARKTPTDVFLQVVQSNRQLNLLIDRRFSPSDVFRQATIAMSYTERIQEALPNKTVPPMPSAPTPGKRPEDVYRRLLKAYDVVCHIGEKLNLEMLEVISWVADEKNIRPSDVFDIASLLVAELAYIHEHLPNTVPPRKVRQVRGKFPSDVYQRVGVLERQLEEVMQRL